MNRLLRSGLLVCISLLACAVSIARAEIPEKDFNTAMQRYLTSSEGQDALLKFLEESQQKQMERAKKKQQELMQAKLEEQFKNPVKVEVGNSPFKGPANAPVTVIEFSDFQCPYCKRGKETADQIIKAYPDKVKFVFKHLPLAFHPQARPAAKATWAAGKQGKFWEMHDNLFDNQDKLADDYYVTAATKIGLNIEQFKKDAASPEAEAAVKSDEEAAQKLGIGGTPSFVVNGVEVRGAFPFDHFKGIIDRWLTKAG